MIIKMLTSSPHIAKTFEAVAVSTITASSTLVLGLTVSFGNLVGHLADMLVAASILCGGVLWLIRMIGKESQWRRNQTANDDKWAKAFERIHEIDAKRARVLQQQGELLARLVERMDAMEARQREGGFKRD